jgi:hypothetical protein
MQLAPTREPTLAEVISGLPLSVVFAEGEDIARIRAAGGGFLALEPPFHISDADAYLVLPIDIGLELTDIFADGDLELLAEAMRDGIVALGCVDREEGDDASKLMLDVEECASPEDLLRTMPYRETIALGRGVDPIPLLNDLEHVACTIASELIDEDGLEAMLTRDEFAGASWRVPKKSKHLSGVDPTYGWSRRISADRIGIECALFSEYEELVLVFRPAQLASIEKPVREGLRVVR